MFKRRLGPDPHAKGQYGSSSAAACPDIWELEDGNIAVIGIRKTSLLKAELPPTAGVGLDEEIVLVPRSVFQKAAADISKL